MTTDEFDFITADNKNIFGKLLQSIIAITIAILVSNFSQSPGIIISIVFLTTLLTDEVG